jgi:hypothetical protein
MSYPPFSKILFEMSSFINKESSSYIYCVVVNGVTQLSHVHPDGLLKGVVKLQAWAVPGLYSGSRQHQS